MFVYQGTLSSQTQPEVFLSQLELAIAGRYKDYKQVIFAFDEYPYTLVPAALFDKNKVDSYLNFSSLINGGSSIAYYKLKTLDAYVVYSAPAKFEEEINQRIPTNKITHGVNGLLNVLIKERTGQTDNKLYLFVDDTYIRLIAFEGQKLVLCNDYDIKNNEDILYFCLAVCEQIGFNPHAVNCTISLPISGNARLLAEIGKYFANLAIGNRPKGYIYHPELNELPVSTFFTLFCMPACE